MAQNEPRIVESPQALQDAIFKEIEKSEEFFKNADIDMMEEQLTEAFINHIVNNATAEAFNGFFSKIPNTNDFGGSLLKGTRIPQNALSSQGSLSNAFGDFLERDLFGVTQEEAGGRATEKGDLGDIFGLGWGRYEAKGTTPVIPGKPAMGSKQKPIIGVGTKMAFIPEEVYKTLTDIQKETISLNVATLKLIEKMRNFIYVLLSSSVGRGRIHYDEIILYSQLIVKMLAEMLTYGKAGGKPFYIERGSWHSDSSKKGYFSKKIEIKLDENWFRLSTNAFDLQRVKTLYKIPIDLLSKIKESPAFAARFFKVFKTEVSELTKFL